MPPRVKICTAVMVSAAAVCVAAAAIGWVGALHYTVHCLAFAGLLWATPSGANGRYSTVWSATALLTGLEFGYLGAVAPIVAAAALRVRRSRPEAQRILLENAGRCLAVLFAIRVWLILPSSVGP